MKKVVNFSLILTLVLLAFFAVTSQASVNLTLDFNKNTGDWTKLLVNDQNILDQPAQDVGISFEKGKLPPKSQWKLISIKHNGSSSTVIRKAGDWEITTEYAVKGHEIQRRALFRWNGREAVKVNGTSLTVSNVRLSGYGDDYYLVPSSFPINKKKFSALKAGTTYNENWWIHGDYSMAIVHSPRKNLSIITGYIFGMDEAGITVTENTRSVDIIYRFGTSALLQPNAQIDCGTQIIQVIEGDENRLKSSLAEMSNGLNNGPPADWPVYLKKAVVYEAHPWGRLEMWSEQDRGNRYSRLTSLLPYYQKLGVSTLWLLPVSWPPPWVYSLPAFDRIDPQNGSPEELRLLINTAHAKDMRVLIDLVTYGIRPDSDEVSKLPSDVWCYDRNGERVLVWGGSVLAADCSSPVWQKRISEVSSYWADNFGFDGTRLDVIGWGQAENWNNPLRMNASIAYGGLQLNKVIRDAMRKNNQNAAVLPEGAKPLVLRNSDMVFGYPLYMKTRDMTMQPDLSKWITDIKNWLEYERLCYPARGMNGIVRFLENHDTVAVARYFGVGPSQALMAFYTFIQGIPMLYQEQETGFTQDLSAWLKLRRSEECFYDGDASYTSAKCSNPNVMCFIRSAKSGIGVVAINFTGEDIKCKVFWPKDIARKFPDVYDAFTGKKIDVESSARISVNAFRPKILLLKPKGKIPVNPSYDVVDIASRRKAASTMSSGEMRFTDAKRWFVDSAEGYLEEEFNPLYSKLLANEDAVDPLPILKRSWSAYSSGLLDGASKVSIGVINKDNTISRMEFDPNKVSDARIINKAGDGKDGKISVIQKTSVSEAPDMKYVSKWMKITPQFVHLRAGSSVLSLARRHGGFPVELKLNRANRLSAIGPSDVYTDNGIYSGREYTSVDGETNPRMSIQANEKSATITFSGLLYGRSWNTVQTCSLPDPKTGYTLSYTVDKSNSIVFRISVKPVSEIKGASVFFACRMPVNSMQSWKAVGSNGTEGDKTQGRVVESRTTNATAYDLLLAEDRLRIDSFENMQNVFLTVDHALYIALFDGKPVDLIPGREYSGTVKITLTDK